MPQPTKTLSNKPYKGARDFYPEDQRLQNYIFRTWSDVLERFGYENYNAPMLESLELYQAKSGEEIVSEQTYQFTDRGGRQVVIRPEMTPSVSRMVAGRRQELAYPLRWYSVPNLWRYERAQRGRLREHWQLNVDMFGEEGLSAEHEMILILDSLLKAFGARPNMYQITINSRTLMDFIMSDYLGLDPTQSHKLAKIIDRMHKIPRAEFVTEADAILSSSQKQNGISQKLLHIMDVKSINDLPDQVRECSGARKLAELLEMLNASKISNAVFDITVMRGFDYYTDIVFELFDSDPENNRSMGGGGRYDGLVGLFGAEPVPTIGFGMGDVTMANFLRSHDLLPQLGSATDVYAILIGDVYASSQQLLSTLRSGNIHIAVDASSKKMNAKLKNAVKKNIRYALFIGEKELSEGRFNLKDLTTQTEQSLSPERIISTVLNSRTRA